MRALSYVLAIALVLTGPSMAGSTDGDLPGIGTFSYCGSAISAPQVMAAIGR